MKYLSFFTFCILLIISLGSAASDDYQAKMAVKECIFSFNEKPISSDGTGPVPFADWDDATHSGVFLRIVNRHPTIGVGELPDYEYTFYADGGVAQTPRPHDDNFGGYASMTSVLPVLLVDLNDATKSNDVNVRCYYVVGNHRIYFTSFQQMRFWDSFLMTQDFDVTEGYFSDHSPLGNWQGNAVTNGGRINGGVDTVRYFDLDSDSIVGYDFDALKGYGFSPNSEPFVDTVFSFDDFPSGQVYAYSYVLENGNDALYDRYDLRFYIKSPNPLVVFPTFVGMETKLYDSSDNLLGDYDSIYGCRGADPTSRLDDECLVIREGDYVTFSITYRNDYDFALNLHHRLNVLTAYPLGTWYLTNSLTRTYAEIIEPVSFGKRGESSATQTIDYTYTFDDTVYQSSTFATLSFFEGGQVQSRTYYPTIGSDCIDYLGINGIDPYISFERNSDGTLYAAFRIDTNLQLLESAAIEDLTTNNGRYCSSNTLEAGEYALEVELHLDSLEGVQVGDTVTIDLDNTAFDTMTYLDGTNRFFVDCSSGSNCPLESGKDYLYPILIEITPELLQDIDLKDGTDGQIDFERIYPIIKTIKKQDPYLGVAIAKNYAEISFDPKDLFGGKLVYIFENGKRTDIPETLLLNPNNEFTTYSFFIRDFSISGGSADPSGLFDEDKFLIELPLKTTLYPFESRRFVFPGTALHDGSEWPGSTKNGEFTVVVQRCVGLRCDFEEIDARIIMNEFNNPFLDIVVLPPVPSYLYFEDPTQKLPQEITIPWHIFGSESRINPEDPYPSIDGIPYTVYYAIYLDEGQPPQDFLDGSVEPLKEGRFDDFVVDIQNLDDSLTFSYDYELEKRYRVFITVDEENSILEDNEFNNGYLMELPRTVNDCRYNSADNTIDFYEFDNGYQPDPQCRGTCCPFGTICVSKNVNGVDEGYCAVAESLQCSNYASTHEICEDIVDTAPNACFIDASECQDCGGVSGRSCIQYDNSISCVTDSCNFHLADERVTGEVGTCGWDVDHNRCAFITGGPCQYKITEVGDCSSEKGLFLEYVSSHSDKVVCPDHRVQVTCEGSTVIIPFFSLSNVMFALLGILLFYLIFRKGDS